VVGKQGINDFWFSPALAAIDLSGSLLVGDVQSGMALRPGNLPGAEPGEYAKAQVSGSTAFVTRWQNYKSSVLVLQSGKLETLLDDPARDFQEFVTDGVVMVWKEGSGPDSATASAPPSFSRYDLLVSPFATNAAKLQPRVLLRNVEPTLGWLRLANGRLSGMYLSKTTDPIRSGALMVEAGSGKAFRSELPNEYSYGYGLFTSESELWGAITRDPLIHFETYIRVPYSALTQIQSAFPE